MRFAKGHGTGNDFVLIPDPEGAIDLTAELTAALCDRRRGIGGDGVLRIVETAAVPEYRHLADEARWFLDYRNADGSSAEMCGNGVRVYARYLVEQGYAAAGSLELATRSGIRPLEVPPTGDIVVDMGQARVVGEARTVRYDGRTWSGTEVWVGNPHVVVVEDELDELGRVLESPELEPALIANVEFIRVEGPGRLRMRVHERGSGETASCGTGACAAAVAEATWRGATETAATVVVPGGRLGVRWSAGSVELAGPAEIVAYGVLAEDWLASYLLDAPG